MSRLAVWSIEARPDDDAKPSIPKKAGRSSIELEKYLENWIVDDVSLIGDGLTLVGQQVTIDDGRLDLLAIDSQDRWIVIEVKPGVLESGALHQALYYAASLARLDPQELREKLTPNLSSFGDPQVISQRIETLIDDEGEKREIALMLVGVGIHPGLARMNEFLERFQIPMSIVSFEVFKPDAGPKLLVREVIEESTEPPRPKIKYTVEAIRALAIDAGVIDSFDRFVRIAKEAGLAVQPQRASIRIAPPANRTRYLMYAHPHNEANRAGLWISVGGPQFVEFFPKIDEGEASAIAREGSGAHFAGKELEQRLDEIEDFLTKHFPKTDAETASF